MNCPKCGRVIVSRYAFCGFCGTKIKLDDQEELNKVDDTQETLAQESTEDMYPQVEERHENLVDEPVIIISRPKVEEEPEVDIPEEIEDIPQNEASEEFEEDEDDSEELEEEEESLDEMLDSIEEDAPAYDEPETFTSADSIPDEEDADMLEEESDDASDDDNIEPVVAEEENSNEEEEAEEDNTEELFENDAEVIIPAAPIEAAEDDEPVNNEKDMYSKSKGYRIVIAILSFVAFALAVAALAVGNNIQKCIDSIKVITDTNKLLNASSTWYYAEIGVYAVPLILVAVRAILLVVTLIRIIPALVKKQENNETTKMLMIMAKPIAISFAASIVSFSMLSSMYDNVEIDLYLSIASVGVLCGADIFAMIRQTFYVEGNKKITVFKNLFDIACIGLIIASIILMLSDTAVLNDGYKEMNFRLFRMPQYVALILDPVNPKTNSLLPSVIMGFVFELTAVSFIVALARELAKRMSMNQKKTKLPYEPVVSFIMMLVVFDIFTYVFEKAVSNNYGYNLTITTNSVLYFVIILFAGALLLEMIRQIIDDIGEKKNSNYIIKRLLQILMLAASVVMIMSHMMDGFGDNRLYAYNFISGLKERKEIYKIVLQSLIILLFIKYEKKIISSFFNEDIEEGYFECVRGLSGIFAVFICNIMFQFVTGATKISIEPSQILSMSVYAGLAILMFVHGLFGKNKKIAVYITSVIEIALIAAALYFAFNMRIKIMGVELNVYKLLKEIEPKSISQYAYAVLFFAFVQIFSYKLPMIVTGVTEKNSCGGVIFLTIILYAFILASVFFDIYYHTYKNKIVDHLTDFTKVQVVKNYFALGILGVEMIFALISYHVLKPKKEETKIEYVTYKQE